MIQLGFMETDITPTGSMETIGFNRENNRSEGILAPLKAQVTVWENGKERCCLTAVDHIGFSKSHGKKLREEIGAVCGITKDKVMLCFSHSHSAPNDDVEVDYYQWLCGRVTEAAKKAMENRKPVQTAWENAYVDIGVNRRKGCKALDRRAGILKVWDAETKKVSFILLRLTAHANVLKRDNYLISPDYFGTVRERFRQEYGCPVVVTQGAAGNVSPKFFQSRVTPYDATGEAYVRSDTALLDMAGEIFNKAAPVIEGMTPCGSDRLSMVSETIALKSEVPDEAAAEKIVREARQYSGIENPGWLEEVRRLRALHIKEQTDETEVQFFWIGNGCLCGVSNEVMVEFALEIARKSGDEHIYFGGYTNGCTGYFPTEEEYDKGGYEVFWSMLEYYSYYNRVMPLRRESASQLIDFVTEKLEQQSRETEKTADKK